MKVEVAKQKGATRIPKKPTEGWMRHELEANGVKVRGVPMSVDKLVAQLQALGYDVT